MLDARRRVLFKNGVQIPLTARNFDLLLVLVQNEGRIVEHDELLEKVWQGTFVEQSNLKKGISALRQTLEESPNQSLYIKTVPRRGYCFVAPVRRSAGEQQPDNNPITATAATDNTEDAITVATDAKQEESDPAQISDARPEKTPDERRNLWQRLKLPILAASFPVLVIIAFGVWKTLRPATTISAFRLENLQMQKLSTSGNVQEAAVSPDGKIFVYATQNENNKQSLWAKRIAAPTDAALQLVAPDAVEYRGIVVSPDGNSVYYCLSLARGNDFLYQIPVFGGNPRKISENISSVPTFSPDGKRLAFVRDDPKTGRTLLTINAEDGSDERVIYTVADNHTMIQPQWSPDGKRFAFISSEMIEKGRIWTISEISADDGDSGGKEAHRVLAPQRGKIYYFEWIRDGSGLLVSADPDDSRQTQLWYYGYPNGEKRRLTNDILIYQGLSASADANTILGLQYEKNGDLWRLDWSATPPTQPAARLTESKIFIGGLSVSPDGRILAETAENKRRTLSFLDGEGVTSPAPLFAQSNTEMSPHFTRDGKSILFTSRRSGAEEIWRADADGRNPRQLTDERNFLSLPKLSPDGKFIYFGKYDGVRWRLARIAADPAGGVGKSELLLEETVWSYELSPDGNLIAYSFYDESRKRVQVGIRDAATNTLQKQFDIAPTNFVRWTPDGKNLLYNYSESSREGGDLWMQPVDGGTAPKLIFDAGEDKIYAADFSPDGRKLYFTRGRVVSSIILLSRNEQSPN